jgi:CheY-like chemotaxis protein
MPDGGRLTIETANAHLDERYAAENAEVPAGQYVMIAVTDTGTGMAPDVAARVFDPFFTTKPVGKGTGLGLSQVFGFVKQSKGHVKIYSEPGQGTTVKVYLPRYFGQEEQQATPALHAAPAGAPTETILVVEDDPRVRNLSVASLRDLGYTIIHAGGASEALEQLAAHPEIALLFTDIVMPGTSGRKLADEAEKLKPGIRVLFTTGFTRNAVVHNGVLDHGVNFIAKPFTIEALAAKVREVLDK